MSQPTERFAQAVRALVQDGPIKQRLARAYAEHLDDLPETDLPQALRSSFNELRTAFNRRAPAGSETRVRANVQKMSASEASRRAADIVALYAQILVQAERAEPLKVVSNGKQPPRYLASRS